MDANEDENAIPVARPFRVALGEAKASRYVIFSLLGEGMGELTADG